MADNKSNIIIGAKDEATPVLQRVASFIKDRFVVTLGDVKGVIDKVISSFKGVVEETENYEDAVASLDSALKNNGQYTKYVSEDLKEFADQLQRTTRFSDDATLNALGLLSALTGLDSKGLKVLTPAIMDFSTRMGVDLDSAAKLVGKTFGSNTNLMARYGISVEGAANSNERLKSIIEQVSLKMGGSAAASAETLGGAMDKAEHAADDLKKTVGERLSPYIIGAQTSFAQLTLAVLDFFEKTDKKKKKNAVDGSIVDIKKTEKDLDTLAGYLAKYSNLYEDANSKVRKTDDGRYVAKKLLNDIEFKAAIQTIQNYDAANKKYDALKEKEAAYYEWKKSKETTVTRSTEDTKTEDEVSKARIAIYQNEQSKILETRSITDQDEVEMMQRMLEDSQITADDKLQIEINLRKKKREILNKEADDEKEQQEAILKGYKEAVDKKIKWSMDLSDALAKSTQDGGRSALDWIKKEAIAAIDVEMAKALAANLLNPFAWAGIIAGGSALKGAVMGINFADGGIVPGTSYSGDNVKANVNSGEMILNQQQQKQLFDMINGGGSGSSTAGPITVNLMLDRKVLAKEVIDITKLYPKGLI